MLYFFLGMPCVFVISKDWRLRAAVRAELLEAGLDARGMDSITEAGDTVARGAFPAAVVFDAAMEQAPGDTAALANLAKYSPFVVIASRVEPGADGAAWRGIAAAILYRPVRVGEIVTAVRRLVAGEAA